MARQVTFRPGRHENFVRSLKNEISNGGGNVHIHVKAGEYRAAEDGIWHDTKNVKIVGDGVGETIIRPAYGEADRLKWFDHTGGLEVGGMTLDWGEQWDRAGLAVQALCDGPGHVHDIEFTGSTPEEDIADEFKCLFQARSGAETLTERIKSVGPSHIGGHRDGRGGGIFAENHQGLAVVQDCHMENEPGDSTWYSSNAGKLIFRRNLLRNNAMGQIRTGGESEVRNNVMIVDHANAHPDNEGDWHGANGLYWASQLDFEGDPVTGGVAEGNTIIMADRPPGGGAAIQTHQTVGGWTFRDNEVRVDDGPVHKEQYYGPYPDRPSEAWFKIEDNTFVGSTPAAAAWNLENRPGSTASGNCFDMPNVGSFGSGPLAGVVPASTSGCGTVEAYDPRGGGSPSGGGGTPNVSMPNVEGDATQIALLAAAGVAGYYALREYGDQLGGGMPTE